MVRVALAVGVLLVASGVRAPAPDPGELTVILGSLADRTRQ